MPTFAKIFTNIDLPALYEVKVGTVSTKEDRFTKRNPYRHHSIVAAPPLIPAFGCDIYLMPSPNSWNLMEAKSYERLVEKLRAGKSASLGASIAEGRGAFEMIARRAIMLRNSWRSVRRGDIVGAARHLGIPPDSTRIPKPRSRRGPGKVSKKHYASATWLELHFGWSPLVGDIYDAIDTLQSDFGRTKVVASASVQYGISRDGYPYGSSIGKYGVRTEVEMKVINPNLALATSMGLTNPAAIAWELVPFSFVVDWFTNVGQILESYTDFLGYDFGGGSRSRKAKATGTIFTGGSQLIELDYQERFVLADFPRPPMVFNSPFGGPKRAATQISLLTQLFLKP